MIGNVRPIQEMMTAGNSDNELPTVDGVSHRNGHRITWNFGLPQEISVGAVKRTKFLVLRGTNKNKSSSRNDRPAETG